MNPIHDKTTALTYAGVGARATPPDVLRIMTAMSEWLSIKGWHLASGGAQGGDSAFAQGAPPDKRTIYLPWQRYNGHHDPSCVPLTPSQLSACMDVAAPLHPAWNRCSTNVRRLHARNAAILLGPDLDRPVNAVVAWTKAGAVTGGTGMALRIAEKHGIPAFNLCTLSPREACERMAAILETHRQTAIAAAERPISPGQTPPPADNKDTLEEPRTPLASPQANDVQFTRGDIFSQPTEAIVNPVNCVGVMGRGLALEFKRRYPAAFTAYRDACTEQRIQPGRVFLYDTGQQQPRWIVHFPTKRHWRDPSLISDIDAGLCDLATIIKRHNIKSIAIPPIGCGLGGLDWKEVRPLVASHLANTSTTAVVFEPDPLTSSARLDAPANKTRSSQTPAAPHDTSEHIQAHDSTSKQDSQHLASASPSRETHAVAPSSTSPARPHSPERAKPSIQAPASAPPTQELQQLQRDWQNHLARAKTLHVHPFFLPGNQELIERLQQLRDQPTASQLPSRQRDQINVILKRAAHHAADMHHVRDHLRQLRSCRTTLAKLQRLAHSYNLELSAVHTYDTWQNQARNLLTASRGIAAPGPSYVSFIDHDPEAWRELHAGIRELAPALGADTMSLYQRQPELYLPPLAPPLTPSQQEIRPHAAYCKLREKWHDHIDVAEKQDTHPYRLRIARQSG